MKRLVALALLGLGFSGCFDFDAAYATYCDGGRCGAGGGSGGGGMDDGGSGGGTGGGMGGGSGGGVGGGAGGGAGGGGGDVDAGTDAGVDAGLPDAGVDAGCQAFLCPQDILTLPHDSYKSSYWTVAPGIVANSLDEYQVWSSADLIMGSTDDFDFWEYNRQTDGGIVEVDRSFEFGSSLEAIVSKGTLADHWSGTRGYIRHYVSDVSVEGFGNCQKADGGVNDPWWYGLEVFSPTDVLFVGYPFTICRWTPATGLVELVDADTAPPSMYFYDAYRTASGVEYVVGGEYTSNQANSAIFTSDGLGVSAPNDVDTHTQNGWNEIDGVGDDAWVVSGSGLVARLMPDGGFEGVFDAGFALRSVSVGSASDVWAVGSNGSRAAYFDGGTWGLVTLPSSATTPSIVWERVKVKDDGLILSGYRNTGSPSSPVLKGIVHSYRRFGK